MDNPYANSQNDATNAESQALAVTTNTPVNPAPVTTPVETPVTNDKKVKPKKKHGFLKFLVVVAILVIGGIIFFKIIGRKRDFDAFDNLPRTREQVVSLEMKLRGDYESGKISANEYISELSKRYGLDGEMSDEYDGFALRTDLEYLADEAYALREDLDKETLAGVVHLLLNLETTWPSDLVDSVDGDGDDEDAVSGEIKMAKQESEKDVYSYTSLDRAYLSKNGHFLFYFTEEGLNATTEDYVKDLADSLENTANKYAEMTGIDFKYEPKSYITSGANKVVPFAGSRSVAKKILKREGIDTDYLNTAMPVYVSATGAYRDVVAGKNTGVLAYYASSGWFTGIVDIISSFGDLCYLEAGKDCYNYSTVYQYPFMNISKAGMGNEINTKLIAGHEMFHHFQNYYCGDGEYIECKSRQYQEGLGNFTCSISVAGVYNVDRRGSNHYACNGGKHPTEAIANVMSFIANGEPQLDFEGVLNDHSAAAVVEYMHGPEQSAFDGYDSWIYMYYYAKMVDDGMKKMLESQKYSDPHNYLIAQMGSKQRGQEVANEVAKKMLTLDYPSNAMRPVTKGRILEPESSLKFHDDGSEFSMGTIRGYRYVYYGDPTDFEDGRVLHLWRDKNLNSINFILLASDGSKWKEIATDEEMYIPMSGLKGYSEFAVMIVDGLVDGVDDTGMFHYDFMDESEVDADKLSKIFGDLTNNAPKWLDAKTIYCRKKWDEANEDDPTEITSMQMEYKMDFKDKSLVGLHIYGRLEPQYYDDNFSWSLKATAAWQWATDILEKNYPGSLFWYIPDDTGINFNWMFYKDEFEYLTTDFDDMDENDKEKIVRIFHNSGYTCSDK